MDSQEISWSAPEFYYHHKSALWYWVTFAITVLLILVALAAKNFLFAIFLVIAETLVVSFARRKPPEFAFALTDRGIQLGDKGFYPYEQILGYAIVKPEIDERFHELVVRTKSALNSYVKIMFPREKEKEIEEFVSRRAAKMEYQESLAERLSHLVRF